MGRARQAIHAPLCPERLWRRAAGKVALTGHRAAQAHRQQRSGGRGGCQCAGAESSRQAARPCEAPVRRRGASPLRARVTRLLVLVGAPKASIRFPVPGVTNRRRGDNYCFGRGSGGGGRRGRVERAGGASGILPVGPRA